MKKFCFLVVAFFLSVTAIAQQTRDFICKVIPSKEDELHKFYNDLKNQLIDTAGVYDLYVALSEKNESVGFVIRDNGKYFILSNTSALNNTRTADVVFYNDEEAKVFKNLNVVKKSENTEIVMIELPASYSGYAVQPYDGELFEGQEIFTASITENKKVLTKTGHIQSINNAEKQIDYELISQNGSNSGQPLLIKKGKDFFYAGINNCQEYYNFTAQSLEEITSFIKTEEKAGAYGADSVEEIYKIFSEGKTKSTLELTKEITPLIDFDLAREYSIKILLDYYRNKMNIEEKAFIKSKLNESAEYGAKAATAFYIADKIVSDKKNTSCQFTYRTANGKFFINDFESLKNEKFKSNDSRKDFFGFAYDGELNHLGFVTFQGGPLWSADEMNIKETKGFTVAAGAELVFLGVGLTFQRMGTVISDTEGKSKFTYMNSLYFNGRLFLPLRIWNFGVFPYIEENIGIAQNSSFNAFRVVYCTNAGFDLTYLIGKQVSPYLGICASNTNFNGRDSTARISGYAGLRFGIID